MPDPARDTALGQPAADGGRGSTSTGPGRVLVALYGVFALAAGARAAVQIATRFAEAPVAYLLSALAAAIYVVATVGLLRGGTGGRRTALIAISVELAGVLVVGTLSLTDRAAFPDETVWSAYGRGYGFVTRSRRIGQRSRPPRYWNALSPVTAWPRIRVWISPVPS